MERQFNELETGESRIISTEDHQDGTTDVLIKTDDGIVAQSLHLPTHVWQLLRAEINNPSQSQ